MTTTKPLKNKLYCAACQCHVGYMDDAANRIADFVTIPGVYCKGCEETREELET